MKWDAPTISVILSTYNRPQALIRVLDSLEHQLRIDMGKVDVVVVDDGSDIDLTGLFSDYSFKFRYLYVPREADNSPMLETCKNLAVSMTQGDIILQLDDDLSFHERTLSEIQNMASSFAMFQCEWWLWTPRLSSSRDRTDTRWEYLRGPKGYWYDGCVAWETATWNQCSSAGMIMPRIVWDKLGGYDMDFNGAIGFADQELALRAVKAHIPLFVAPIFFHIDDSETGSWRDILNAKLNRSNEKKFLDKHPDMWDWCTDKIRDRFAKNVQNYVEF
jgi:glycosyltransferase involved in cell wall biosynthesis